MRYRNPKGIDIIDDFLPLTLTIQHDGPKQRGLMSSLWRMFVEFAAWYVPLRVLKIICWKIVIPTLALSCSSACNSSLRHPGVWWWWRFAIIQWLDELGNRKWKRHHFLNSVCCTHHEQPLGFRKQVSNILVYRDKASLAWENYVHLGWIFRRYSSKREVSVSLQKAFYINVTTLIVWRLSQTRQLTI